LLQLYLWQRYVTVILVIAYVTVIFVAALCYSYTCDRVMLQL
jgi:hypothetical protein